MTTSGNKNVEIKTYNCVHLEVRQCTQFCTSIQADFLKPENGLVKYGNNHYLRGVPKKNFHSKVFKFVAGQNIADKDKSSYR